MGWATNQSRVGKFRASVNLDGQQYETTFHIVPHKSIPVQATIGHELLNGMELTLNQDGCCLKKIEKVGDVNSSIECASHELTGDRKEFQSLCCAYESIDSSEVNISHIADQSCANKIKELCEKYDANKKTKSTEMQTKIFLKDSIPVCQRPRRLAPKEKQEVDGQIQKWLTDGIIRPSCSEYASPIVLVPKNQLGFALIFAC